MPQGGGEGAVRGCEPEDFGGELRGFEIDLLGGGGVFPGKVFLQGVRDVVDDGERVFDLMRDFCREPPGGADGGVEVVGGV